MNVENKGNEPVEEIAKDKQLIEKEKAVKERKPKKELTPREIEKRKKMLIYPLFALIFIGAMWLIFTPSGDKEEQQTDGFNPELPLPKDEDIVGDKRTAYEQEAMRDKQEDKRRSLQDFAFSLEEEQLTVESSGIASVPAGSEESRNNSSPTIQSSAYAYRDVNRQLDSWYDQSSETTGKEEEMESRILELERQLEESNTKRSAADEQLELIEKSYAIASKYMPGAQEGNVSETPLPPADTREKIIPHPVSEVSQNVVSLLSAPTSDDEFKEQYDKPRNLEFITATGETDVTSKNSIQASVYQTQTISDGKELQLRLLEPMRAGNILVPENTILKGTARIGGERLQITISSIQYAGNVVPVEITVHDIDGMQGIFVPNPDGINAAKEIAANMGTSMGSSITITDDAGSQLAADMGRSVIQGASQFFSKKMREVKVTLKAGYKVLLLPYE